MVFSIALKELPQSENELFSVEGLNGAQKRFYGGNHLRRPGQCQSRARFSWIGRKLV